MFSLNARARVKVELEIPGNVYEAARKVSERFKESITEVVTHSVKSDLESHAESHFEAWYAPSLVPLYVEPKTKAFLQWWYDVVSRQLNQGDFSEFLLTCVRRYTMPFLENVTKEEQKELDSFLAEIGQPEKEAFAEEIKQLLAS